MTHDLPLSEFHAGMDLVAVRHRVGESHADAMMSARRGLVGASLGSPSNAK